MLSLKKAGKQVTDVGKQVTAPFKGLDKLLKLPMPMNMFGSEGDDDHDGDDTTATEQTKGQKAMLRMRNIFAAPFDLAKESLDDLKELITPKSGETYEFLQHAFEEHFFFQHLAGPERRMVIGAMHEKSIDKGTTIIEQGQKGEYLYVIQQGSVKFVVNGVEQANLGERGTVFGELSLLYDNPTAATVIANTDVKVWRVSQLVFRRIKAAHAIHGAKEKRDTICKITFFKDLASETIYQLAESLQERTFKKGEQIAKKGHPASAMFIIREGVLTATNISIGSTSFADCRLGPGEHFGERAIITGEATAANVVAETDGVAWVITKESFQRTVGHLNLEDLIIKSGDGKMLAIIPFFAYSDIDYIESEMLVEKIVDSEHKKGHVFATIGQPVLPAFYIIRKGGVSLSNGKETRHLTGGEIFGFGGETLILTSTLKQKMATLNTEGIKDMIRQSQRYADESVWKANSVPAIHTVVATEDTKVGMLTLEWAGKILRDPGRLGRAVQGSLDPSISSTTLEKRKVLGAGTFGTVWLTRHAGSDKAYALKVQYKRQLIDSHQAKGVIREKNVMARMHHPFVMGIINAQQDELCLYMVMDLMQGGELGSVMRTRKRKHLAEGSARFYAGGILEGLSYMHRRHYVYRDLKGENVLLDNDGYAVIVDLGFAKYVPDKTFTFCGTPLFIAPEIILSSGHDKAADMWSYGVLLFEMLTGENPFYTNDDMDQMDLFKAICKGKFVFPEGCKATPDAKDLVKKILQVDPKERLGCKSRADLDIRDHDWFGPLFDFTALYRKEMTPPWKPKISSPFDGSNFGNWDTKPPKNLKGLTRQDQQLFVDFGPHIH